ncbi:DUF423 domain-containing protein [Aquimarina addita]|uniref:DUF423 domain-containing protein n=1 Tax=Aquimarina addita TaxID=870485 RepID=A0ABP7XGX4_9FLAO
MNKQIIATGGIAALIAVLLGAFGAHGLEKLVDTDSINSFTTGVRYQMYHAIVCILLGTIEIISETAKKRIFYLFVTGMILFSGSIYLLVIDEVLGVSLSSIGFITPLGGLLLILGWVFFVFSIYKKR